MGVIAEINVFSVSDEMLRVMGQTEHRQVDCSRVVGRQQQQSDRWRRDGRTSRRLGRRAQPASTSRRQIRDVLQPVRQVLRCSAVKSSVDNDRHLPPVWTWCAWVLLASENWREHSVICSEWRKLAIDPAAALRTDWRQAGPGGQPMSRYRNPAAI